MRAPLILFLIFSFSSVLAAQEKGEAEIDSVFSKYMNQAWDHVERENYSDSLQKEYAGIFYNYYKENPGSETGKQAFQSAFLMWGNSGAAPEVDEAVSELVPDSELWRYVVNSMGNAFMKSKYMTPEEFVDYQLRLTQRVTNKEGLSSLYLSLARYYDVVGKKDELKEAARKLVELDAGEFYVDQGLGFLYSLEALNVGQAAPEFTAKALDGSEISLNDYDDRIVVLQFWGTWCGPCKPELPYLKTIDSTYTSEEVQIIGIALDDDMEKLERFLDEEGMNWPQIAEPARWDGEITTLYNVNGVPKTYILKNGSIAARNLRKEALVAKVSALVEGQ